MAEKLYLGKNMKRFNTASRYSPYDMVVLNLDDNNYISSPYAKLDDSKWSDKANGEHVFVFNGSAWEYNGTVVSVSDLTSEYGLSVIYTPVTGLKNGDTLTVNKTSVNGESTVTVDMTRSGSIFEMKCPLVKPNQRQQVADTVLGKIYGMEYQPFHASEARLNPAAELGDAITAYGVYSGIYKQDTSFTRLLTSDIGAEISDDVETEIPYDNETVRRYKRKFADAEATLEMLTDSIQAKVSSSGGNNSFAWELTDRGFFLKSNGTQVFKCDANGITVDGDGTFTGEIYASNIRSDNVDGYGGSFDGAGLQWGSVDTGQVSSGINSSLGYANFAQGVFNAYNTASYVKTSYLMDAWGNTYHPEQVTLNGRWAMIYVNYGYD